MATILHLPPEISGFITEQLSTEDFFRFRQTCKYISTQTATYFARNYFQTRYVMLERRSLETLTRIAEHPALGTSIQTVEICTNHLLPLDELRIIDPPSRPVWQIIAGVSSDDIGGDVSSEEADDSDRDVGSEESDASASSRLHLRRLNEKAYRKSFQDQEELVRTGYDIKCLTQSLKHIVNCKTINIADDNRPWGLKRLQREIGTVPQRCLTFQSSKSIEFIRRIAHAVFTSIAASNIPIEVLDVSIGCLIDNASRISPDMLIGPSAILAQFQLPSLRELNLLLNPNSPEHAADSSTWTSDLVQFIRRFPELSDFSLDFEHRDSYSLFNSNFALDFVHRDSGSRFSRLCTVLHIPKLEVLRLGSIDCTSMELAFFLLRHQRTLREVYLDTIDLVDGDVGRWRWLIEIIRDTLLLTYFSMNGCTTKDIELFEMKSGQDTRCPLEATDHQGFTHIMELLDGRAK